MKLGINETIIENTIQDTNPIIRPPAILIETALTDLNDWTRAPGMLDILQSHGLTPEMLFLPWQPTIQGILTSPSITNHDMNETGLTTRINHAGHRAESYREELEWLARESVDLINDLKHGFYTDRDAYAYRIGYSPIRLLGWWRKCLKDEMDWRTTNGLPVPPIDPSTGMTTSMAPPKYGPEDLTPEGLARICMTANSLHGRNDNPEDLARMMSDTARNMASQSLLEYDGAEWAYWTGSEEIMDINKDDAYQMVLRQALTTQADYRLLDGPLARTLIGLDFEMTGLDPIGDWVINAGWAWIHPNEIEAQTFNGTSRMYGVPESRRILGNPAESINGISMNELDGLAPLEADLNAQDELMDAVLSSPLVVHNARTEDRFLEQCVDGYAEAKRDGLVRIIDTRLVSKWLDEYPGKVSNRLEDYATHWGVLNEDETEAHEGLSDARIMLQALSRHLTTARQTLERMSPATDQARRGQPKRGLLRNDSTCESGNVTLAIHGHSGNGTHAPLPGSWLDKSKTPVRLTNQQ